MAIELSSGVIARARLHAALGEPIRLAMVDALRLGDASPGELAARFDLPSNLVAHHLGVLADVGVIERVRSEGDGRRSYVRLRPGDVTGAHEQTSLSAARVVFVCKHNSARSQLAAALWRPRSVVPAASAGTQPAPRVHPRAVAVAARHGIDLGNARTVHVDQVIHRGDLVIAVCDNAHEEMSGSTSQLHWSVPDPARPDTDEAFEAAFQEIVSRIEQLAPVLNTGEQP